MNLVEEQKVVKNIPVFICKKATDAQKALVILSHGFGGSKESFRNKEYLRELAEMGYYAVAMDNRFHGERPEARLNPTIIQSQGKVNLLALRKAIKETADDVSLLIDEFSKETEIDRTRIAMIGVSMGGFIVLKALTVDQRITVGIPIISSPYWDDIPEGERFIMDDQQKKALRDYAALHQPAGKISRFFPSAILMQIGEDDPHFDGNKVKMFYQQLQNFYPDAPEKTGLICYPNTQHEFTDEMWNAALQWLQSKL